MSLSAENEDLLFGELEDVERSLLLATKARKIGDMRPHVLEALRVVRLWTAKKGNE